MEPIYLAASSRYRDPGTGFQPLFNVLWPLSVPPRKPPTYGRTRLLADRRPPRSRPSPQAGLHPTTLAVTLRSQQRHQRMQHSPAVGVIVRISNWTRALYLSAAATQQQAYSGGSTDGGFAFLARLLALPGWRPPLKPANESGARLVGPEQPFSAGSAGRFTAADRTGPVHRAAARRAARRHFGVAPRPFGTGEPVACRRDCSRPGGARRRRINRWCTITAPRIQAPVDALQNLQHPWTCSWASKWYHPRFGFAPPPRHTRSKLAKSPDGCSSAWGQRPLAGLSTSLPSAHTFAVCREVAIAAEARWGGRKAVSLTIPSGMPRRPPLRLMRPALVSRAGLHRCLKRVSSRWWLVIPGGISSSS